MVEVAQEDRDRLAQYYADGGAHRLFCGRIRAGDLDSDPHMQMLAAHRAAAEQRGAERQRERDAALVKALDMNGTGELIAQAIRQEPTT